MTALKLKIYKNQYVWEHKQIKTLSNEKKLGKNTLFFITRCRCQCYKAFEYG